MAQRPGFDMKRLSMGTKGLFIVGLLLLIDLFLPWESIGGGTVGGFEVPSFSVSGLNGIGVFILILILGLLIWEGLLAGGVNINMGTVNPALISAIDGAAIVLFGLIRALIAIGRGGTSPSIGLWIGLILIIAMAYASYVRFQESRTGMGGMAAPPPPPPPAG